MRQLEAFKKGLDAFLRWFCITLFVVLVALVCWQVFVRQVLNAGDPWTEVAARVVFIWHGLIGAAYVIGEKDDVAIDFLVRKLPEAAVKSVEVLAHGIVGFFAAWVMVFGGMRLVTSSWDDVVQLLPVSQGFLYLAIVISGGIILLYSIIHIVQTIVKPVKKPVDDEDIDITTLTEESI
ncbi:MAG: TRAP transporter small permease [Actinomycetes bacterium]